MTTLRLRRREVVLMTLTALVCFAIAIPLSEAAGKRTQGTVTVPVGGSVTFSGMSWTCDNRAPLTATDQTGTVRHAPQSVGCYHLDPHKGIVGVWTLVNHSKVIVLRCTYGVIDCPRLGVWPRTPVTIPSRP